MSKNKISTRNKYFKIKDGVELSEFYAYGFIGELNHYKISYDSRDGLCVINIFTEDKSFSIDDEWDVFVWKDVVRNLLADGLIEYAGSNLQQTLTKLKIEFSDIQGVLGNYDVYSGGEIDELLDDLQEELDKNV